MLHKFKYKTPKFNKNLLFSKKKFYSVHRGYRAQKYMRKPLFIKIDSLVLNSTYLFSTVGLQNIQGKKNVLSNEMKVKVFTNGINRDKKVPTKSILTLGNLKLHKFLRKLQATKRKKTKFITGSRGIRQSSFKITLLLGKRKAISAYKFNRQHKDAIKS